MSELIASEEVFAIGGGVALNILAIYSKHKPKWLIGSLLAVSGSLISQISYIEKANISQDFETLKYSYLEILNCLGLGLLSYGATELLASKIPNHKC